MSQNPGEGTVADGEFAHMDTTAQQALVAKIEAALAQVSDEELATLCQAVEVEIGNKHAAAEAVAAMKAGIEAIKQIAPLAALLL
jgi:hypothetical protein